MTDSVKNRLDRFYQLLQRAQEEGNQDLADRIASSISKNFSDSEINDYLAGEELTITDYAIDTGRAAVKIGNKFANMVPGAADSYIDNQMARVDFMQGKEHEKKNFMPRVPLPESLEPQTKWGEFIAEVGPYFTPFGRATKAPQNATKAAKVAHAVYNSAIESIPGAAINTYGGDGDESFTDTATRDIGLAMATRGVISAGAKAKDFVTARKGTKAKKADIFTQGSSKPDIAQFQPKINENDLEDVSKKLMKASSSGGRNAEKNFQPLVDEIKPRKEVLDAAEELGMRDDLIPSHYSNNPRYVAIEQAVKSIPDSTLAQTEKQAILKLGEHADKLIEEGGGVLDKSGLSDSFKQDVLKRSEHLKSKSDEIYNQISREITPNRLVEPKNTLALLQQRTEEVGGRKYLTSVEQKILHGLEDTPTYARMEGFRKDVGEAIGRNKGEFANSSNYALKGMYSALSEDHKAIAESLGFGDLLSDAKNLVKARKELETNLETLLSKDLSGSVMSKAGRAVVNLGKGDFKQFDQIMKQIPKDKRQQIALSALNDAFTQGSRQEKSINLPGFVDWYEGLQRNTQAFNRLMSHIPNDSAKRLKTLFTVSKAIRDAKSSEITTGRLNTMINKFAEEDGVIGRIFGNVIDFATDFIPISGIKQAKNIIAKTVTSSPTDRIKAADELIASPIFKEMAQKMAAGKMEPASKAEAVMEEKLKQSNIVKRWLTTLTKKEKEKIGRIGIIAYLTATGEETDEEY